MICKLISTNHLIPNQQILEGESLIVGRNRKCKIKEINCSRNYAKIQLLKEKKLLKVEYLKNGKTELIRSGDFLSGPGFSFKIAITGNDDNNGELNFIQF